MRILALETLIKCAREADQVGVLDLLGRDAIAAKQFCLDLGDLVKVEDDG